MLLVGLAGAPSGGATAHGDESDVRNFLRTVMGFSELQVATVERGEVVSKQLLTADKSGGLPGQAP